MQSNTFDWIQSLIRLYTILLDLLFVYFSTQPLWVIMLVYPSVRSNNLDNWALLYSVYWIYTLLWAEIVWYCVAHSYCRGVLATAWKGRYK